MKKIKLFALSVILVLTSLFSTAQDSVLVKVPYSGTIEFKYKPQIVRDTIHDTIEVSTPCPVVDTVAIRKGWIKDTTPVVVEPPARKYSRWLYVDKTDTMYNSVSGRTVFGKYCKDNKIDGTLHYSTSSALSSTSNFANFQELNKVLSNNGVVNRKVVLGSSSTSNFDKFLNSTTDSTRKFNGLNLELEWWNSASTFDFWLSEMNKMNTYAKSKGLKADFYMGWYKNLGTTVDTVAARKQLENSNMILLHDYENNKVSYSYTRDRLLIIANAAKNRNQGKAPVGIIFSEELISLGAANDFQGNVLKTRGFDGMEADWLAKFDAEAPQIVKDWVDIKLFVHFMKRYTYRLILPK